MKTREHAHLCAAAIGAHAVLELFAAVVVFVIFGVGAAIAGPEIQKEAARSGGDPAAAQAVGGIFAVVLGLVGCLFLVRITVSAFAAWGVWNARPWGKILGIISGVLSCLSFPLGTAVGAYALWFILGPQGTAWFSGSEVPVAPVVRRPPGAGPGPGAPPPRNPTV